MNKLTIGFALLALTSCVCREYPRTCAAVTIVGAGCLKASLSHSSPARTHDVTPNPIDCTNGSSCR